jgi:hypothetical protein
MRAFGLTLCSLVALSCGEQLPNAVDPAPDGGSAQADGGDAGAAPSSFCASQTDVTLCEDFEQGTWATRWSTGGSAAYLTVSSVARSSAKGLHVVVLADASPVALLETDLPANDRRSIRYAFALRVEPSSSDAGEIAIAAFGPTKLNNQRHLRISLIGSKLVLSSVNEAGAPTEVASSGYKLAAWMYVETSVRWDTDSVVTFRVDGTTIEEKPVVGLPLPQQPAIRLGALYATKLQSQRVLDFDDVTFESR